MLRQRKNRLARNVLEQIGERRRGGGGLIQGTNYLSWGQNTSVIDGTCRQVTVTETSVVQSRCIQPYKLFIILSIKMIIVQIQPYKLYQLLNYLCTTCHVCTITTKVGLGTVG